MKGLARTLAVLEAAFAVATLSLCVSAGSKAIQAIRFVRLLQAVFPGPQTTELAAQQATVTRVAVLGEVVWVSCAALGLVAAFGLWRLQRVGLYASVLLSIVYVAALTSRWRVAAVWEPMAAAILIRLALAGPLIRWGWKGRAQPDVALPRTLV